MVVSAWFGTPTALAQTRAGEVKWPRFAVPTTRLLTEQVRGVPAVQIGPSPTQEYTLWHGIAGAVRMPDGTLAVFDAGNFRMVLFDGQGRFLRAAGREGDAPGEFRLPRWFGRCSGGSLVLHDGIHARLTFLHPSGAVDTTIALPAGTNFDQLLWCSRTGRLLMLLNRLPPAPAGTPPHRTVPTHLVAAGAGRIDTLATVGRQQYFVGGNPRASSTVPLGTATLAAGGRTRVYTCDAHEAACASFDTSGARRGEFVLPLVRLKMTGGPWRASVREHLLEDPTRWARPILEKVLNEVPPPRGLPLIDRVRVDADDNLWARTLDNYLSAVATWVVVSPEGRLLRLVATPRPLLLRDLGPDYLLGVTEDQDGVEEVQLYRRPAADGVSGSGTRPPAAAGRSASRPR